MLYITKKSLPCQPLYFDQNIKTMDISSKTYLRQERAPRHKEATRGEGQGVSPFASLWRKGFTQLAQGGGPGVPTVKYYMILNFKF